MVGQEQDIRNLLKTKQMNICPPPMCFWKCDPTDNEFFDYTKVGVLQYVVIRITTTFVGLLLDILQKDTTVVLLCNGIGMSIAMFTLVNYYLVIRQDIERYRPVLQFLSVKFVIFLGFYQSLVLKSAGFSNSAEIESMLTAVEMVIASIIHLKAFNYKIFTPTESEQIQHLQFSDACRDAFNWLDLPSDFRFLLNFFKSSTVRFFCKSTIPNLGRGFIRSTSEEWQDQPFINIAADEIDQGLLDLRG
jgi:hypothetical protein